MKTTFTRGEVARLLGVKGRKLEGWIARGILLPCKTSEGAGNPHLFSFEEVVRVAVIHEFQEVFGAKFCKPGSIVKQVRKFLTKNKINKAKRSLAPVFYSLKERRDSPVTICISLNPIVRNIRKKLEEDSICG